MTKFSIVAFLKATRFAKIPEIELREEMILVIRLLDLYSPHDVMSHPLLLPNT